MQNGKNLITDILSKELQSKSFSCILRTSGRKIMYIKVKANENYKRRGEKKNNEKKFGLNWNLRLLINIIK